MVGKKILIGSEQSPKMNTGRIKRTKNEWKKKEEEMKDDFDEVPENENQICYPDEDCLEILKEKED